MGSRWDIWNYSETQYFRLPTKPGCYAFYGDGKLLYVGSSNCIRERINGGHRIRYSYSNSIITPWGNFHSLVLKFSISRKYGDWAMRELRLIRRLQPSFNKTGNKNSRRNKTAEVING